MNIQTGRWRYDLTPVTQYIEPPPERHSMMVPLAKILGVLARPWHKPRRAIILGAESAEYGLFCRLEGKREYQVLFFIDEEPWSHRITIGGAELRYPKELVALCKNHQIDAVLYCDDDRARDLPKLPCELIKVDA